MKFLVSFLLAFQFTTSIYTNPIPEPTLDCIVPLVALAGAAFGAYGGSLGSGFAGQYPYNAGGAYGGPYYGVNPYYGGNPYQGGNTYQGGNPYYSGNPFYGGSPYYDYDF